jgi:hypothetical protein
VIILQVALLETLDLTDSAAISAQSKGHFSLYSYLVRGHTKYNGVQLVYCNPFPAKPFYGSHHMYLVMIRPPGLDHGPFVVLWHCRQIQFGMHGFCSFPRPHHKTAPGPKRLTVHSCQRWKQTTLLKMVVVVIIVNIDIIFIRVVLLYLLYLLYLL